MTNITNQIYNYDKIVAGIQKHYKVALKKEAQFKSTLSALIVFATPFLKPGCTACHLCKKTWQYPQESLYSMVFDDRNSLFSFTYHNTPFSLSFTSQGVAYIHLSPSFFGKDKTTLPDGRMKRFNLCIQLKNDSGITKTKLMCYLKILKGSVKGFYSEKIAERYAMLKQKNVPILLPVDLIEYNTNAEKRAGIVTKLYDGSIDSLAGSLPFKAKISLAIDICQALTTIHSRNLVVRDLKCGNILYKYSTKNSHISLIIGDPDDMRPSDTWDEFISIGYNAVPEEENDESRQRNAWELLYIVNELKKDGKVDTSELTYAEKLVSAERSTIISKNHHENASKEFIRLAEKFSNNLFTDTEAEEVDIDTVFNHIADKTEAEGHPKALVYVRKTGDYYHLGVTLLYLFFNINQMSEYLNKALVSKDLALIQGSPYYDKTQKQCALLLQLYPLLSQLIDDDPSKRPTPEVVIQELLKIT